MVLLGGGDGSARHVVPGPAGEMMEDSETGKEITYIRNKFLFTIEFLLEISGNGFETRSVPLRTPEARKLD